MLTLKDSLIIENNSEIFDFRFEFDNILMWPFMRFDLHNIPIFKEYNLGQLPSSREKLTFIYLKNTLLNNPFKYSLKTKYDILMFCSGITNVKKGDKYFNRVSDHFAFINKDETLLIEDSVRRRIYYTPRYFPNICYHDFIPLAGYIKSKFVKPCKKDIITIKNLRKFLEQLFPYQLEKSELNTIENALLYISKRLTIYYYLYNKLFDKFNPKVIFLEDGSYGGNSYILKWAKARNIITIEPEHGIVFENHPAYNYGNAILNSDFYKEYLPDYFLTYGKYWGEVINLPVKKIAIGNPFYCENIKKISTTNQFQTKTKILIVFSGGIIPEMKKIVLKFLSIIDNSKYDVSFRVHPTELPDVKERYSEIIAKNTIKIDTESDVYLSLLNTDFVVGEPSTVLVESIGFCKSVFVIDHPFTDLYFPRSIIKRFSNAEELMNLIITHNSNNEINKDYIWEPDWEVNYKNFMNRLMSVNLK
ncbi:MAG: hypothetical protein AB1422_02605 [bacterium]